ncbi:hypothetical protein V2G26_013900 [Clonostachys chloroleuca]
MTIDVILGAQWGDEGKGKLVGIQSRDAQQLVCRAAVTLSRDQVRQALSIDQSIYFLFANKSKGEWSLLQLSPLALWPHEPAVQELHRLRCGLSHVRHYEILRL